MDADGGSQMVLEGLHFKPQWMSLMGCIVGCAEAARALTAACVAEQRGLAALERVRAGL